MCHWVLLCKPNHAQLLVLAEVWWEQPKFSILGWLLAVSSWAGHQSWNHGITESLQLEKAFKIIKPNHQPSSLRVPAGDQVTPYPSCCSHQALMEGLLSAISRAFVFPSCLPVPCLPLSSLTDLGLAGLDPFCRVPHLNRWIPPRHLSLGSPRSLGPSASGHWVFRKGSEDLSTNSLSHSWTL